MSDDRITVGPAPIDLDRLNEAERRALRLLAEGHTAKSVASLLGCTPGAVNERLREARRKTGAGSSRELARLLRDQENRDDEIGVAGKAVPGPSPATDAAGLDRGRLSKGLMMTAIVSILALSVASAAGWMSDQEGEARRAEADPMVAAAMAPGPTPHERHAQLIAEPRDAMWAVAVEKALDTHYRAIAGLTPALRVTCGRTLCEVAGSFQSGLSRKSLQAAMDRIQTGSTEEARRIGLKIESSTFGFRAKPAPAQSFVVFLSRADA